MPSKNAGWRKAHARAKLSGAIVSPAPSRTPPARQKLQRAVSVGARTTGAGTVGRRAHELLPVLHEVLGDEAGAMRWTVDARRLAPHTGA